MNDSYTDWERKQHDADGGVLASVITQLADAQHFLETRQIPVSDHYPIWIGKCCTSAEEVDRIAAVINAEAEWNEDGTQYAAVRAFGREVQYRATYIVKEPAVQDAPQVAELAA